MKRDLLLAVWSWLIASIVLEAGVSTYFAKAAWTIRGGLESLIALSAAVPIILIWMGLWEEHLSIKAFAIVALFFCADLILIWSASLVH
jgi:hypothetical protein